MDEKTEELRDIFVDVTDAESVTEPQEAGHGSLATDAEVDERLRDAVDEMRDRLDFRTDLPTDDLVAVVRGFYAGDDDAAIADRIDADAATVAAARRDLHLVQDDVAAAPIDLAAVRRAIDAGDDDPDELAARFDVAPADARTYRRIARVQAEIRTVNDRYRSEFEAILQDRDLSERLTTAAREDGLDEATEGQETNTSL